MKVTRESFFWMLVGYALLLGFLCGIGGVRIKATEEGMYLVLFSAMMFVLAGIFTSVAIKFQQLQEREDKSTMGGSKD